MEKEVTKTGCGVCRLSVCKESSIKIIPTLSPLLLETHISRDKW